MNSARVASFFYLGTLFSSVGTFAFNVALIAFMFKAGFHLGHASLIIALQRFLPVAILAIWGHLSDTKSPRVTVVATEAIAGLASFGLLLIWKEGSTNYFLLLMFCVVRSIVVALQTGSRAKICKLLSSESYQGNSKHAIWLNKATQGATLFGGVVSWVLIKYFSFQTAILFDAATFIVNGLIIYSLTELESENSKQEIKMAWHQKFKDLIRFNSQSVRFDILLMIPMMGTVAYMSRLAGSEQQWTGIFMAVYGLAVWCAGFLERGPTLKISAFPFWISLGLSFIVISKITQPSIAMIIILFIKDLSFWILFHRISSYMQADTPISKIGGVMSARNCVITAILTSGEVLVGAWSNIVPLAMENIFRGSFALVAGVTLFLIYYRQPVLADRPRL